MKCSPRQNPGLSKRIQPSKTTAGDPDLPQLGELELPAVVYLAIVPTMPGLSVPDAPHRPDKLGELFLGMHVMLLGFLGLVPEDITHLDR